MQVDSVKIQAGAPGSFASLRMTPYHSPCSGTGQADFTVPLKAIENEAVRKLLDVVSSIIANEYIQVAKENPDVFMDIKEKGG